MCNIFFESIMYEIEFKSLISNNNNGETLFSRLLLNNVFSLISHVDMPPKSFINKSLQSIA